MIASREEFLLVVTNWMNSSAGVRLVFKSGGNGTSPLSTALIIELIGEISGVDTSLDFVVFSPKDSGIVSIGFRESLLVFETPSDLSPSFASAIPEGEELEEMISIAQPSGTVVSLFTLKGE
jgi:hypothetical protein